MKEWGEKVLEQIEEVSIDMTGNYKSLVYKICPNAIVTVDRFHVTKIVHEELNRARIAEKKIASSTLITSNSGNYKVRINARTHIHTVFTYC